jgi:lysophospholipase L1-like esterase
VFPSVRLLPASRLRRALGPESWLRAATLFLLVAATAIACSSPSSPSPVTPPVNPPTNPPVNAALAVACPSNVSVTAPSGTAVAVTFAAPTSSGGQPPVQVSCTRTSGSMFTVGPTQVQCTARDAAGASASCTFTVTVNPPVARLTRTRFLAFGDSFTAGEVTVPVGGAADTRGPNLRMIVVPGASYPTQLLSMLQARYTAQTATLTMTNSGAPGEWAEDGARRLPGILASQRPEVVLLMEGINELGALGSPGISRAIAALDTMAKEVRNRGARLFLATVAPTRPGGKTPIPASQIMALNDRIRVLALGEGAVLVDVYPVLNQELDRYVGVDGLHLNEAGYQKLAELFFAAIRNDLEAR